MSFYASTATFFLLHCVEWDRVVALPRHKFVTGATLLQLDNTYRDDIDFLCFMFLVWSVCLLLTFNYIEDTIIIFFNNIQSR